MATTTLPKVRVQLLDPSTGQVISDVDVLSTASCISYANTTQTIRDFRGIPKGSSFNEVSVKEILDNILYPHIDPVINYINGNSDGIDGNIVKDTIVYKEKSITVESFTMNIELTAGSEKMLSIVLKIFDEDTSKIEQIQTTATVTPGSLYLTSFEIPEFITNRSFQIIINDGTSVVESPIITYKFVYPTYIGFCTDEILSDDGTIDSQAGATYLNTLIRQNSKFIKKFIGPVQNYNAITVIDPLYASTEMFPFILYNNTLNKPAAIRDTNNVDITGSFIYNSDLRITIHTDPVEDGQYSIYMSSFAYNVGLSAVGEIKYNFIEDNSTVDFGGKGTPILAGFDVLASAPIDYRTVVEKYVDLAGMEKPYEGLVVYVKAEKTFFKYINGNWNPTNQQIFLETDGTLEDEDYDLTLGQWNDIIINIGNGKIYKKLENRRWEYCGQIATGSDSSGSGETIVGPAGEAATISIAETITGLPGTAAKVENLGDSTNANFKFTIPQGQPGENATIEIGSVTSGTTASVENVGTKTNAILDIVLPKGEDGAVGQAATVEVGSIIEGETFDVTNVGSKNNAILDFTFPPINKTDNVRLDNNNIVLNMKTISLVEEGEE